MDGIKYEIKSNQVNVFVLVFLAMITGVLDAKDKKVQVEAQAQLDKKGEMS